MPISADEIQTTTESYLSRFPGERERLARLLAALGGASAITSRSEFRGHVTCGVVLVDRARRVLHIRHNALDRWLLPGGHLEPGDTCLTHAALREAFEETGIPAGALSPLPGFESTPIDIDVHAIPANPPKDEPDHWHFDFRHAYQISEPPAVELQAEEVSGVAWLPANTVPATQLREKLRQLAPSTDLIGELAPEAESLSDMVIADRERERHR